MEIVVSMLMEIGVNGHGHIVAYAHYGTKGVCAQTHMRMLPHILKTLALFLHGIVGSTGSEEFDAFCLYFGCLTGSLALYKLSGTGYASTGSDLPEEFILKSFHVGHNLDILDGRAVVECYEVYILAATL